MKQFMDNENANNIYDEVAKIFDLPSSQKKSVLIDDNYFGYNDDGT